MSKQPENKITSSFKESELAKLAEQVEWRDWTAALLKQRIAELEGKLAAGDMPILEGVSANGDDPMREPTPVPHMDAADEPLEEDVFSAFLEG